MAITKVSRNKANVTPRAITALLALIVSLFVVLAPAEPASSTLGSNDYPYATGWCQTWTGMNNTPPTIPSTNNCTSQKVDPWSFYQAECVSFVAWRLNHDNGVAFTNNMTGPNGTAGHWGNGYQWSGNADAIGYPKNTTPARGSVAQWAANHHGAGSVGHVAYVDTVNADGSIVVEEYNAQAVPNDHKYRMRTIPANSATAWPSWFIHVADIADPPSSNNNPYGSLDLVSPQLGGIRVAGWALDPDAGTGPIWVHVYVDGAFQQAILASGYRSDLAATYPAYGGYHAFDTVVPYHWGGTHTVTLYAINVGSGSGNPAIGSQTAMLNYDYTQQGSVQGDFNGDGKRDVAVFYDYYGGQTKIIELTGTGTAFNNPAVAWDSGVGNWDWSHTKPVVADFNGDGKSDIAVFYDYGSAQTKLIVFLSNGAGFNTQYVTWDSGVGNFEWPRAMVVAGDFTGDGKADIVTLYNYPGSQSKLLLFTGNGAGQLTPIGAAWDSGPGNWEWVRTKLAAADMNGDGKMDIVAMYNYDNAQTKIITFLSAGTTFNSPVVRWDSGTGNWEWPKTDLLVGDFTGDSKADVAGMYDYGSSQTKLLVFAGNGSGGVVAPATVAWDSGVGNWEWWRSVPFVGEFTGDGKVDVGAFYNYDNSQTKLILFTSVGATFTNSVKWDSGPGSWEWGHILIS